MVRDGYDKISHAYRGNVIDLSDSHQSLRAQWVTELQQLVKPGAAILDLGCGNGIPTTKLLADAGYFVTGADISPVQVDRARQNVPRARFTCIDMTKLHLASASFDAVVSLYAIIHVPMTEQPGLFSNIAHWLKSDGYFMTTVGAYTWTGTVDNWLDANAPMYWSHADSATYVR